MERHPRRLSWYSDEALAVQLARTARRRDLSVSQATRAAVREWVANNRDDKTGEEASP